MNPEQNPIMEELEKTHEKVEIPVVEREPLPEFNSTDEWTVLLVGQVDVYNQKFPTDSFQCPERVFWKAEQLPTTPKGTVNDVYYLYHVDKEKRITLYLKHP